MKPKTWKLNPSKSNPGWYALLGPYDSAFVDDLKLAVAECDREWVPDLKLWRVAEGVLDDVQRVIDEHTVQPLAPLPTGAAAFDSLAEVLERVGPWTGSETIAAITTGLMLGAEGIGNVDVDELTRVHEFVDARGRKCLVVVALVVRSS